MNREDLIEQCFDGNFALQKAWRKSMWVGLKETDLSPNQLSMLITIEHLQPVSGKDLAKTMRISRSAVTQLIDTLRNYHYIEREEDPQDRRISYIRLSAIATKKLHEIHKQRKLLFIESTKSLTNEELEIMTAIQNKMIKEIEG